MVGNFHVPVIKHIKELLRDSEKKKILMRNISRSFPLGTIFPPRNIGKCLVTFLIVTTGGYYWYVEPRDAAEHPKIHRMAP